MTYQYDLLSFMYGVCKVREGLMELDAVMENLSDILPGKEDVSTVGHHLRVHIDQPQNRLRVLAMGQAGQEPREKRPYCLALIPSTGGAQKPARS